MRVPKEMSGGCCCQVKYIKYIIFGFNILVVPKSLNATVMVSKKKAKKIINAYYNPRFPGSMGRLPAFNNALKNKLNINISISALRRLLKTASLHYQVNVILGKHFKHRPFYSRGNFIEAWVDPVYINLKPEEGNGSGQFIFLLVVDSMSRYMYTVPLRTVKPDNLKRAFTHLFNANMPKFPVITSDPDPSLMKLTNTYFAKHHIFHKVRRSVHHMGWLEGVARSLKRKFIMAMQKDEPRHGWSEEKLKKLLKDLTYSYNHSVSTSHKKIPAEVNNVASDPMLRRLLYPNERLEPFDTF